MKAGVATQVNWPAGVGGKGNERDGLESDITRAIVAGMQIGYVLHMSKGLIRQFDEEDGEGDVWWHMLYIDDNRISNGVVAIAAHNGHQPGSLWESILDTTWHKRKLDDGSWRQRVQHLHTRR